MDTNRDDQSKLGRDAYHPENSRKNVNADVSYNQNRYMRNRKPEDDHSQWGSTFRSRESREPDSENIRIGKKLHDDYDRNAQDRYGNRQPNQAGNRRNERHDQRLEQRDWDEGNFFHTGPNPRGSRKFQAEERERHRTTNQYDEPFSNHYRNQDRQLKSMNDHYGSRPDSVYRRPNNLNYGDQRQGQQDQKNYVPFGSGYEAHRRPTGLDHNAHTEGPGTGSRYKEDDYRYGSGNHNFYKEGRYQRGGGIGGGFDDNKGFFERVGDGIRDAWGSITNDDRDNVNNGDSRYYRKDNDSRGRNYDRGYESGPRWADESENRSDRSSASPKGHRRSSDPDRHSWTDYDAQREKRW